MLATLTKTLDGATTVQQLFTIDRTTGAPTPPNQNQNALGYLPVFPYGQDLTGDPNTSYSVTGDIGYTSTYISPYGYGTTVLTVELSNPYTLAQLDADADALLAAIDPATMAWGALQEALDGSFGPPDLGIPAQYGYGGSTGGAIPKLNAASWSLLTLGDVSSVNYFPNTYSKLISYIAMAGNYCQKTLTYDYNQNLINQSCLNGVGACSVPFEVIPPPLAAGQNTIVLVVPNSQCS